MGAVCMLFNNYNLTGVTMMKKIAAIFIALTLALAFAIPSFAVETSNRVYGDEISAKAGETIKIPVKIENCSGFMGFEINVTYDSNVLTPISAVKGSILTGMMDDSIETSKNSDFKVIYSGSDLINEDGEIIILTFTVKEAVEDKTVISLSAKDNDAFDDKYNDVKLNCESVTVNFNSTENPDNPDNPDNPSEGDKLSVRIKKWAASLATPFNSIMSIIVAPIVFVVSLFE